ncbi:hypothetical protein DYBT9623_00363 [Dyadobacter sp. CECT 9623]|uniref:Uncharacterized protein n=1 Tax=Dyadobacter linearis TaxID=2823330 RepID=A0ABM8UJF8_9BACT|nr:hypothetical protein DYBT9623_00363 [Dyadobacter sp. CECT 9623]
MYLAVKKIVLKHKVVLRFRHEIYVYEASLSDILKDKYF